MFDSEKAPRPLGRAARVAFVSTFPPQQCGLATFCQDMRRALCEAAPADHPVVPVAREGEEVAPDAVAVIRRDDSASYVAAARTLNISGVEAVCLQHEYGIYGGPSGAMLNAFLDALTLPVVAVLHTILPDPSAEQRAALDAVIARASRVVTMAERGRAMLREVHGVADGKIAVVPHGYPARPRGDREALKRDHGLDGRHVLTTFGLLSPGKGIETVIEALPRILSACPDALYLIAGRTHPEVVKREGEGYRDGLKAKAEALGVRHAVRFEDRYLGTEELLDLLQLTDVYVTPYPGVRQITSGTLSFAFGMGLPIVSTPYWHAEELLADDLGRLVPFADPAGMGDAVADLLVDEDAREALSNRVWRAGREMSWPAVGRRYARIFAEAARAAPTERRSAAPPMRASVHPMTPRALTAPVRSFRHLLRMTDGVGIAQHARFKVPDRAHGYCLDDCVRVLIAAAAETGRHPELEPAVTACAAFTEHAWHDEAGRFRNFMAFDRTWCERAGSEDSNGRALWALGWTSARAADPALSAWAEHLYQRTRGLRDGLRSPRALAFAVLGEAERERLRGREEEALYERFGSLMDERHREVAARAAERGVEWPWFETRLAYDNARLCQALLVAAERRGRADWRAKALDALAWLTSLQDRGDHLHVIGTGCFHEDWHAHPCADEQALEAAALADAAAAAWHSTGEARWQRVAADAYAWFEGRNRLGVPLVDLEDGACRDGLHQSSVNENCGAESVLAYLSAAATLTALAGRAGAPASRRRTETA